MAATSTVVASPISPATPGISDSPSGTASVGSNGTMVSTFQCQPCCGGVGADGFLPAWFGPNGLCPGAVDNSKPVSLHASFMLFGTDLPFLGLLQVVTVEMIADDYQNPDHLKFKTYHVGDCPNFDPSAPSNTFFLPISGFFSVGKNFWKKSSAMDKNRIQPVNITLCTYKSYGSVAMLGDADTQLTADNYNSISDSTKVRHCSPFSLTFGKYTPSGLLVQYYGQSPPRGRYEVTFTL